MRKGIFGLLSAAALFAFVAVPAWAQSGTCPENTLGHASAPITTTTYTIGQNDQCKLKVFNSGSAVAATIPAPGTAGGFTPNFFVQLFNEGAGTVTLTPTKNNAATTPKINNKTTLTLATGQGAAISVGADGNWYANTSSGSTGGVLGVASGGTGLASGTSGGILGFTGSTTIASSAALAANGVVIGGGAGATPTATAAGTAGQILVGSATAPSFVTPASALTKPANPSAITPGTSTAQMLGLGANANPSVLTPVATGRVYYTITFSVVVGSTSNGATFACSHGTGTPPANAGANSGTADSAAVAYLAGAATEKAVITCSGIVTGATLSTALWFDVAVLNTTGSQAVTASVATFNAFEF